MTYRTKTERYITYAAFGLYTALLVWLVLFKLSVNITDLPHIRNINLIPFYYANDINPLSHIKEVVYNFLAFIPLGVYSGILQTKRRVLRAVAFGFCLSLLFEALQYAFAIGVTDLTDIIVNTAGAAAGVALFCLLRRMFRTRCVFVVNGIMLFCEVAAVLLLVLLLASNG